MYCIETIETRWELRSTVVNLQMTTRGSGSGFENLIRDQVIEFTLLACARWLGQFHVYGLICLTNLANCSMRSLPFYLGTEPTGIIDSMDTRRVLYPEKYRCQPPSHE